MGCDQYCQAWWGTWWPWAEANQGMLSGLALGLAGLAIWLEARRANRAEAEAARLHRVAADERAAEAERSALARQEAELAEFKEHVRTSSFLMGEIMLRLLREIEREIAVVHSEAALHAPHVYHELSTRSLAGSARDTLLALIPTAPRDSILVYEAQHAVEVAGRIFGFTGGSTAGSVRALLEPAQLDLENAFRGMRRRMLELAPDAEPGAD